MSYLGDGLSFNTLRGANKARLPQFKNAKGELAHSEPDGSDWTLGEWCTAVAGELGEATKDKFNRVSERVGSNVYIGSDDWHYRGV